MPFGIGFFAAAGAVAPAGAVSYDLLQTEILTGSQASVTFSSLGDYASDYQHLQLRVAARSDRVDNVDFLQVTFNSDSAANYSLHYLRGSGSGSPSSLGLANQSHIWAGFLGTANHTADIFAPAVIDILDPFETSKYTTLRALGGVNSVEPNIALLPYACARAPAGWPAQTPCAVG